MPRVDPEKIKLKMLKTASEVRQLTAYIQERERKFKTLYNARSVEKCIMMLEESERDIMKAIDFFSRAAYGNE